MATTNIYATSFLEKIRKETDNSDNLLLPNHHLIKKNTLIGIEKLNSRQLYSLLVYTHPFTPTSQKYLNELLKTDSFDWKQIYLLPRLVTLDSYSCSFQYKILNYVLCLNKKRRHLFVLSANFLMRQYSIYFTNAV